MFKSKPYIVAEIGSNWVSLQDCLDSIIQAKLAGADAAKFQLYDWNSLYGPIKGADSILNGVLDSKCIPKLKEQCDRASIDFMCSAFSPDLIDIVDPYVKVHKVASSEMCHVRMLERLNKIGKPVLLSTGAQTTTDIKSALKILGKIPVTLMYCVSSYPANDIDLSLIQIMRDTFALPVGFSDHALDYLNLPAIAVQAYGATVIEKHFTAIDSQTPDSGHSLNPDQFKKMVQKIKGDYKSVIGPTLSERDMILKHKRRLVAIHDISNGETLIENVNFGIYRSLKEDTSGMIPFSIDAFVNGKTVYKDIKAGDSIGPTDFYPSL